MPPSITRREFVTLAAGATALGLSPRLRSAYGGAPASLPDPADAPFDTVVVLIWRTAPSTNVLGWLPGANGQQDGLIYTDIDGVEQATWPLAGHPNHDFYRCDYGDPVHDWQGVAIQFNEGHCV